MKYWKVLLLCLISISFSCAQRSELKNSDKKSAKYFKKGLEASRQGKHSEAIALFEKAIRRSPDFTQARLLLASEHYETNDLAKAEAGFESILEADPDFNKKIYFTLGLIKWKLDKYEAAHTLMRKYLEIGANNDILEKRAQTIARQSKFATNAVKNPTTFSPISVGPGINSLKKEYSPSMTAKGDEIVFTRRKGGYEFLYYSKKVDGEWTEAQPIEEINSLMEAGSHTISPDGNLLIFTSCGRRDGYGGCDLYYSTRKNGKWSHPANLGKEVNSGAWDSHPSLANNGNTLFFSSNRQGTLGGKDIWVTHRHPIYRMWSIPQNLGPEINTAQDDKSPFMHYDNKTLYFMSNGRPGMGNFDLFVSIAEGGHWSEPQNLGYPINTKFQEGTLKVDLSGENGLITSDRKYHKDLTSNDFSRAETDIYFFKMPDVVRPSPATFLEVQITGENGIPLEAEIFLEADGQAFYSGTTNSKGKRLLCLPVGNTYAINVQNEGYIFHSERIDLDKEYKRYDPFIWDIGLKKIAPEKEVEEEVVVILKNVHFESGSAELLASSLRELNILIDLLESQESMKIEIRGHTDNVGSESDNLVLSQDRAEAVRQHLIQNGIESSRLFSKGFGETQPIADNETEEGKLSNRRTEFVILK